jgi:hypothetical protein
VSRRPVSQISGVLAIHTRIYLRISYHKCYPAYRSMPCWQVPQKNHETGLTVERFTLRFRDALSDPIAPSLRHVLPSELEQTRALSCMRLPTDGATWSAIHRRSTRAARRLRVAMLFPGRACSRQGREQRKTSTGSSTWRSRSSRSLTIGLWGGRGGHPGQHADAGRSALAGARVRLISDIGHVGEYYTFENGAGKKKGWQGYSRY